jgi:hypothetical protein
MGDNDIGMTSSDQAPRKPMTPERREKVRINMIEYRKRLVAKREADAKELAALKALHSVKDVSE